MSEILFTVLVGLVGLERIAELAVSTRNAAWSFARGGVEYGREHFPVMVVLHTALLVGAVTEVWVRRPDFVPALGWTMLALVVGAQGLRWWCIGTLGRQWNTRVIVVPGSNASRAALLARLDALLPGTTTTGTAWLGHHLPLSSWRWSQPDGPVLLAGDAAGLVNPMTGEGIYYAVATGVLAGRVAAHAIGAGRADTTGAQYRSAVHALLARHLRHTAAGALLAAVPAVVIAGIRAAHRDQRVFDDLVEIGLGQGLFTRRVVGGLVR